MHGAKALLVMLVQNWRKGTELSRWQQNHSNITAGRIYFSCFTLTLKIPLSLAHYFGTIPCWTLLFREEKGV